MTLVVARLAAIAAIILPIFSQSQLVIRVAKRTVTAARALIFRFVTYSTFEFFSEHCICLHPLSAITTFRPPAYDRTPK